MTARASGRIAAGRGGGRVASRLTVRIPVRRRGGRVAARIAETRVTA